MLTYGVYEVWKQELSTLIAIISGSASSRFSANYTIDQPGRFLFGKFQEEAIASSCLLLATPLLLAILAVLNKTMQSDQKSVKFYKYTFHILYL